MKILFMGTPDFAVKPLEALAKQFDVVGVVTQPDKPRGRHMVLTPSPVKEAAQILNIPVYQPAVLKNGAFQDELSAIAPDMIVVVAYGKILPPYILNAPPLGCINLHGSLLPKYRGAAPMQRAIMEGEEITGVTTMFMAEGMDTGDMLEKASTRIGDEDDFETIHDRLSEMGADLLISTIKKCMDGTIVPEAQDDRLATYAAKIENDDCYIHFDEGATALFHRIRGLSPFPLAYCFQGQRRLKIVRCRPVSDSDLTEEQLGSEPGTVISCEGGKLLVRCGEGALLILLLVPEGKGKMSAADYIHGRKIQLHERLS